MASAKAISSVTSAENIIKQVRYTAKVYVTGGREGFGLSDDGHLKVTLTRPGGLAPGTNPEQLFAAGWAACFLSAMQHNARTMNIKLPEDTSINSEVDLGAGDSGYNLQARLNINLPGMQLEEAEKLVQAAHQTCPYSKATKGNINVDITVTV